MKAKIILILTIISSLSTIAQNKRTDPRYMLMNGFDFQMQNVDKLKYTGHFNVYIPISKSRNYGFNTGLLKLNNLNNDSIVRYQEDQILINPLDQLAVDSTYLKQYNKYKTQTSISTYSGYFQVLRKLVYNDFLSLSIHGHTELLISNFSTSKTIDSISSKKIKITSVDQIPKKDDLIPLLVKKDSKNYQTAAGNFGLGLTLDCYFKNNFSLFMQGTFGWSLEHPTKNSLVNGLGYEGYKKNWFYLVRSYFQYNTSKTSNAQIIVGVDYRGIIGQVPLNSVYLGLNLDFGKIADLITK
ncbi:MAG: hypothetical protein JST78_09390 [Bacteroidetes bacterium]|nr:hypothetical protein [Bacteroidota bacterium]